MTYMSTERANARGRLPGMRRRRGEPDAVAAFLARGFAVVPAAAPDRTGPGCSCTRIGCPMPGAHPLSRGWRKEASTDPAQLERWRMRIPEANYASPTGGTHDVLEVPAAAGARALESLLAAEIAVGPVARTAPGDGYLFFTTARSRHRGGPRRVVVLRPRRPGRGDRDLGTALAYQGLVRADPPGQGRQRRRRPLGARPRGRTPRPAAHPRHPGRRLRGLSRLTSARLSFLAPACESRPYYRLGTRPRSPQPIAQRACESPRAAGRRATEQ